MNRLLLCLALFVLPAAAAERAPAPLSIDIRSSWAGILPNSARQHFAIRREQGSYILNGRRLDRQVETLLKALAAPPLSAPDLENLGMDQAWLDRHAADEPDARLDFARGAPNQQALYRQRFADKATMRSIISSIYGGMSIRTDDYPHVRIAVTLDDGTVVTGDSAGQFPFMLPWTVTTKERSFKTYNADVARAIAALLPEDGVNRDRMSGANLELIVKDNFATELQGAWVALDVENRAAPALAVLRRRYSVAPVAINDYNQIEYGVPWTRSGPREANLHVELRRADLPGNFSDAAVLLYRDGKAEGAEALLANIAPYETLALSVPWLAAYMRANPEYSFSLSFVHGTSLGDKAWSVFATDMHVAGKDRLVAEIAPERSRIALLTMGSASSYWLVLPDRRVVLWRYTALHYLMNWQPSDLQIKDCDKGNVELYGGCVGAVIAPDGTLAN